jgi:hypothetical protein
MVCVKKVRGVGFKMRVYRQKGLPYIFNSFSMFKKQNKKRLQNETIFTIMVMRVKPHTPPQGGGDLARPKKGGGWH